MGLLFSAHSEATLETVHPDMQRLVRAALATGKINFNVCQGLRTREQELQMWLSCHNEDGTRNAHPWLTNCNGTAQGETSPEGYAGTGISNHQSGHAVDLAVIVNGAAVWDGPDYTNLAGLILGLAAQMKIPTIWGGTFKTPDMDHFELNRAFYPIGEST